MAEIKPSSMSMSSGVRQFSHCARRKGEEVIDTQTESQRCSAKHTYLPNDGQDIMRC